MRAAVRVAGAPIVYVTVKDFDAVTPVVSVKVTVQVLVPPGSPTAVTTGCKVMTLSERIAAFAFQFASPFSHVWMPLTDPLHVKVILFTLLKLLPLADSVGW